MTSCGTLRGQKIIRIIPNDRSITFVKAGQTIKATNDVVVLGQAIYVDMNEALLRYREMLNDKKR